MINDDLNTFSNRAYGTCQDRGRNLRNHCSMKILPLLLLLGMMISAYGADDIMARVRVQDRLYTALSNWETGQKGQKGDPSSTADIESSLQELSRYWDSPETPNDSAIVEITRAAQSLMRFGQGRRAYGLLLGMQRSRPEAMHSPIYCYQLFFTTLYGKGDRAGAMGVFRWMEKGVKEGRLSPNAPEYVAVKTSWDTTLQYTDSDLLRILRQSPVRIWLWVVTVAVLGAVLVAWQLIHKSRSP
jgi:hypothetical protein